MNSRRSLSQSTGDSPPIINNPSESIITSTRKRSRANNSTSTDQQVSRTVTTPAFATVNTGSNKIPVTVYSGRIWTTIVSRWILNWLPPTTF
jgi:hypothetical protein